MGSIDGNDNQISFGSKKVELGKSDGVKKETFSVGDKENIRIMNTIFKKFDKNSDGYLDTEELSRYYNALHTAATDGKMSKREAADLASKLKLSGVEIEHFEQFTQILATENDGVSTNWDGNKCTIKDGDMTLIKEYTDGKHNRLSKKTKITGNTTEVTEFYDDGRKVTTTVGSPDLFASKTIEEYSGKNLVKRTKISGDGTTVTTEFGADGKQTSAKTEKKQNVKVEQKPVQNTPTSPKVKKENKSVNKEVKHPTTKDGKIDYTKIPDINQSWVFVMLMKYHDDPPEREYLDTLAKFPDVNLKETASLLKKYPETGAWMLEYFKDSDEQAVKDNFSNFLNNLGINFAKEGYFVAASKYNDKYIPTLVSYSDRIALSQEKTQEKIIEFLDKRVIS